MQFFLMRCIKISSCRVPNVVFSDFLFPWMVSICSQSLKSKEKVISIAAAIRYLRTFKFIWSVHQIKYKNLIRPFRKL